MKKIPGVDEPDGYQIWYEVYNKFNRLTKVTIGTVFPTYSAADNRLCEILSEIEEGGGRHNGGDIEEYYSPY